MASRTDNAETIPGSEIQPTPTMQRKQAPGVAACLNAWLDASPKYAYLLPAIAIVLFLSVFPLIVSLYLSLSSIEFVRGDSRSAMSASTTIGNYYSAARNGIFSDDSATTTCSH